jgi:hypothetical protein
MKANIVYMVSDGEYSDFSVRGIFDNEPDAEAFRDFYQYDNDITEWPLNPQLPKVGGDLYRLIYFIASERSDVDRVSNTCTYSKGWRGIINYASRAPDRAHIFFFAKGAAQARKIAADKVTALKAGSTLMVSYESKAVARMGDNNRLEPCADHVRYTNTWRLNGSEVTLVHSEKA